MQENRGKKSKLWDIEHPTKWGVYCETIPHIDSAKTSANIGQSYPPGSARAVVGIAFEPGSTKFTQALHKLVIDDKVVLL